MSRVSRLLILLLVICIAFAFGYEAMECVHDCEGEESCPICLVLANLSLFLGVTILPVLMVTILLLTTERKKTTEPLFRFNQSPIRLKVKLLN